MYLTCKRCGKIFSPHLGVGDHTVQNFCPDCFAKLVELLANGYRPGQFRPKRKKEDKRDAK